VVTVAKAPTFLEEVGDFLASVPSRPQLLEFAPSQAVQKRYPELLHSSSAGSLTREEQYEFSQFELIEMLLPPMEGGPYNARSPSCRRGVGGLL
jgi:hypothetical protein